MSRLAVVVTVALAVPVLALSPVVGGPPDPSAATIVVRHCAVEYENSTLVGSPLNSTLYECLVTPGTPVKAGQLLGRLECGEARAEVSLRETEAASDVDVRLGEARSAQAQSKLRRTAALLARNSASREEYNEHQIEAEAARLEVEKAKQTRQLAIYQLERARAVLRSHELLSPHDGVVTDVLRRQGEAVAIRDPVFQVVDNTRLRVVAQVDVAEVWQLAVGRPVRVVPEVAGVDLPIEHVVFDGKIAFIDTRIDPQTRTCKLHVTATNRDGLLRSGIEARVEIDPPPAGPVAAGAAIGPPAPGP